MKIVPSSWIEIPLSNALEVLETGMRPKGGVQSINEGLPSLGGEHLTNEGGFNFNNIKYIPVEFANNLTRGKIEKGDILIVKDGATTGKVSYVDESFSYNEAYINEHIFKCVIAPEFGLAKYFFWFLFSPMGKMEILKNFRGVAQGGIIQSFSENVIIPLPPIEEQKIIVEKLDLFYSRFLSAKTKLNKMPSAIRSLRHLIINYAISGDLTKNWRANRSTTEWQTTTLLDVVTDKPRNGYSPKPVEYKTSVKSLTLTATTSGIFDPKFFKYIDEEIKEDSHLWLKDGDILIQRGNTIEYVGVSAIYRGSSDSYIYPDLMMKVRANEKILTEYLYYCLSSTNVRSYFRANATGVSGSMPKINQAIVINTPISLPSMDEQREIVRRVEILLELTHNIEKRYFSLMQQLENCGKKALENAFFGFLTKNWREKNQHLNPISSDLKAIKRKQLSRKDKMSQKQKQEASMEDIKTISVLEVLQGINKPISAKDLLLKSGYPGDASTDQIESFFIQIRDLLAAGKVTRRRIKHEDYFEKAMRK